MTPKTTTKQDAPPEPKGRKGRETREKLLRAARTVIDRDGFLESRITDIAEEAGVSLGTFYNYFVSKEQVFEAVVAQVNEEMLHPAGERRRSLGEQRDPRAVAELIEENNRAYLKSFQENAGFMRALEQAAHSREDFRMLRLERATQFAQRNARTIEWLQEIGYADPDLTPTYAAIALSGMVGRMAHDVFVLGQDVPFEDVVDTTNRLWLHAVGLLAAGLGKSPTEA